VHIDQLHGGELLEHGARVNPGASACKRRFEGDMLLLPSLNANMRLVAAS
jgi:hypothetical protein